MSVCLAVNQVIYRMTRLLKSFSIPDTKIALLFGTFATWCRASNTDRGITKKMSREALASLVGQPTTHVGIGVDGKRHALAASLSADEQHYCCVLDGELDNHQHSVKYQAALRMAYIWHIYLNHRSDVPPESMFAYYCGVLMDLHQRVLHFKSDAPLEIHEVYLNELAPEQIEINSIITGEHLCTEQAVVEYVWAQYIRDCPNSGKSPLQPAKSGRKRKNTAASAAQKSKTSTENDTPFSMSLMCPPPKKEEPVLFTQTQSATMYLQIMRKGVLGTTSTRYISSRLHDALVTKCDQNLVIIRMVKLFFLGAYKDCTIIAPPYHRVRLYSTLPTATYYNQLDALNPKELYSIIAEHLIAAARQGSALYKILSEDPDWKQYNTHSLAVCDRYLRTVMYGADIGIEIPRRAPRATSVQSDVLASPSAVFYALAKAVGPIKNKIPASVIASAKMGLSCTLHTFYETVRLQGSNCEIVRGVLEDVGVVQADIDFMMAEGNSLKRDKLQKLVRVITKGISPHTVSVLYLYIHFLIRRSMFAILPIQHDIDDLELAGKTFPSIKVCINCFTICTQTRSATGVCHKSKEGLYIDNVNEAEGGPDMCMCKSNKVREISLRTNRVMGITVNSPDAPKIITRCADCGTATVFKHIIGVTDLCQKCFCRAHRELEGRVCVCGREFSIKNPAVSRLSARNPEGKLSMYMLCKRHKHLLEHVSSPSLPIGFYRNLLPPNERL